MARNKIIAFKNMKRIDLINWLSETDPNKVQDLYSRAYAMKVKHVGKIVYFRGIIELSNICAKNCFYCGIRKDNDHVERFQMTDEEVLESAKLAFDSGYGSIVLQSGERSDENFVAWIEQLIGQIKKMSNSQLGLTLSLGEQTRETYRRWFKAGAHRYLLRIETSNPELYQKLHPADHSHEKRLDCLKILRQEGFQVGTGVMIGLPHQTLSDLADDILFFKNFDVDMIGMGPYISHHDTPLVGLTDKTDKANNFDLSLKMIALTRLVLEDVNIASTTALQAIDPAGREKGLLAGANIIMPNITHTKYRRFYQLYDDKPCLDENALVCKSCLETRIKNIGEEIGYGKWGDSKHFKHSIQEK
ncbi:MAG: [FeFe] hydrogenase H-cluster radical SAM maturase HydE [Candidatus Omnitrophica bacterium]|nr:[FeFe] hydrogenase H-cluster radical SAM maturase HydE [Candidatus Omnitrophota bacterium]